jgi:hypothetical protein
LCDPELEVCLVPTKGYVIAGHACNAGLLDVGRGAHLCLQCLGQLAGEQLGQRKPHIEVVDEIVDSLIKAARLRGRRVDLFPGVEDRDLRAVEDEAARGPVAFGDVDARMIGTTDDDLPSFTELDLLPRALDHVKSEVYHHTDALGLRQKVSHAFEDSHRLVVTLRSSRAWRLCASRHTSQEDDE